MEGFARSRLESPGPGPADRETGPGVAPSAVVHKTRRYPARNGYPMRGRTPYEGFRVVA